MSKCEKCGREATSGSFTIEKGAITIRTGVDKATAEYIAKSVNDAINRARRPKPDDEEGAAT